MSKKDVKNYECLRMKSQKAIRKKPHFLNGIRNSIPVSCSKQGKSNPTRILIMKGKREKGIKGNSLFP